jgi:hypothetical protein
MRFAKKRSGVERQANRMLEMKSLMNQTLEEEKLTKKRPGEEDWNPSASRALHYSVLYW